MGMGGSRCKYNLGKLGLLDILRGVDRGGWRYILGVWSGWTFFTGG